MPKITLRECAKKTIEDIEKHRASGGVKIALIYWNAVKVLDPKDREKYHTEEPYDPYMSSGHPMFTEAQRMYLFQHYVHDSPVTTRTGSR